MRVANQLLAAHGKARRVNLIVVAYAMSYADRYALQKEIGCPGTLISYFGLPILVDDRMKQPGVVLAQ